MSESGYTADPSSEIPETDYTPIGGSGGSGQVLSGTGDPTDPPDTDKAIYYRTDIVRVFAWDGSQWVQQLSET